jgi:hypothetical protein
VTSWESVNTVHQRECSLLMRGHAQLHAPQQAAKWQACPAVDGCLDTTPSRCCCVSVAMLYIVAACFRLTPRPTRAFGHCPHRPASTLLA